MPTISPRRVTRPSIGRIRAAQRAGSPAPVTTTDDGDISGPCDEAEHANDPRCRGGAAAGQTDDDRSGHGSGSDDHDEGDDDDRSGSNSGKG